MARSWNLNRLFDALRQAFGALGLVPCLALLYAALGSATLWAQEAATPHRAESAPEVLETRLREWLARGSAPGASFAFETADGRAGAVAVGFAGPNSEERLLPEHKLLSGSVGKTYVAACVLRLIARDELTLQDRATDLLDDRSWLSRLPNASELTVQNLLQHQSGLPRYVLTPELWTDLLADPDRSWTNEERLAYIFDAAPLFEAGTEFAYSDTNYLILGEIIEAVSGASFEDHVAQVVLEPLELQETALSSGRRIEGLAGGRAVWTRGMGLPEAVLGSDGRFVLNPQFEGCGGGFASTPRDLARWARLFYSGRGLSESYRELLENTVPAPQLGAETRYGPGLMDRPTAAGRMLGHDGIFPGYSASMGYFPERRVAAALQINACDPGALGKPLYQALAELVRLLET